MSKKAGGFKSPRTTRIIICADCGDNFGNNAVVDASYLVKQGWNPTFTTEDSKTLKSPHHPLVCESCFADLLRKKDEPVYDYD
jgi:hypothetical protein